MILAIAIISLITFVLSVAYDCTTGRVKGRPNPRIVISIVLVIAWWTINVPVAIIFLIIVCTWILVYLFSILKRHYLW